MFIDNAWLSATGPVPIRMTNDYLFRALLQRSNNTLKGLICSLLHLCADEIVSVIIMNPIELGKNFGSKDFSLISKYHLIIGWSSIWKCRSLTSTTGRSAP